jgi:hypothetical protein
MEQMMEFLKAMEAKMETQIGFLTSEMKATQHKVKASQKKVMAKMDDNKEEMMTREETTLIMANMEATIRSGQEETKTGINSIQSKLEETTCGWRTPWRLHANRLRTFVRCSMRRLWRHRGV